MPIIKSWTVTELLLPQYCEMDSGVFLHCKLDVFSSHVSASLDYPEKFKNKKLRKSSLDLGLHPDLSWGWFHLMELMASGMNFVPELTSRPIFYQCPKEVYMGTNRKGNYAARLTRKQIQWLLCLCLLTEMESFQETAMLGRKSIQKKLS